MSVGRGARALSRAVAEHVEDRLEDERPVQVLIAGAPDRTAMTVPVTAPGGDNLRDEPFAHTYSPQVGQLAVMTGPPGARVITHAVGKASGTAYIDSGVIINGAGIVYGNLLAVGNITATGTVSSSDARLKDLLDTVTGAPVGSDEDVALDELLAAQVSRWRWAATVPDGLTPRHDDREHWSPTAQDVPAALRVEMPDGSLGIDGTSSWGALLALVQREHARAREADAAACTLAKTVDALIGRCAALEARTVRTAVATASLPTLALNATAVVTLAWPTVLPVAPPIAEVVLDPRPVAGVADVAVTATTRTGLTVSVRQTGAASLSPGSLRASVAYLA